jgi:flavin reductase (DIM6/NTAB) family NADH-FMN oxidoreductase RutF
VEPGHLNTPPRATLLADHFLLRGVLARFASGVTVTTTRTGDGRPIGITANSFSSLSLDPPLVLVCVAQSAHSYLHLSECDSFGISILASHQSDVALRYATAGALKFTDEDHFNGAASGVPLIRDALSHLECTRHQTIPGGDHVILVGQVIHSATRPGEPLVSYNRAFGAFAPRPAAAREATD